MLPRRTIFACLAARFLLHCAPFMPYQLTAAMTLLGTRSSRSSLRAPLALSASTSGLGLQDAKIWCAPAADSPRYSGRSPVQRSVSEPAGAYDAARRSASAQADGRGGLRRRSSLLSGNIEAARASAVQHVYGVGCTEPGGGGSGGGGSSTIPEQQVSRHPSCKRRLR